MNDYNAAATARSQLAKERLEIRFKIGRERQAELVRQVEALHIRDRLVWPHSMYFRVINSKPCLFVADQAALHNWYPDGFTKSQALAEAMSRPPISVHPHALGQMVGAIQEERKKHNKRRLDHEKCGPTVQYIRSLGSATEPWEETLFENILEGHFHNGEFIDRRKNPSKFLFRLVGEKDALELRGFVSRNFNIFLPSYPMLRAFMETCDQLEAQPVESVATPVRFSLKCFLPYVFEPVPGEFVTIGAEWSNSDFGAGRLTISGCAMRVSSGNLVILNKGLSRTHLGPVIEETDLELSDEAMLAAVKAQCLIIRDVVRGQLEPNVVNKILLAIKAAHEEQIPWSRLERELGTLLRKKEVQQIQEFLNNGLSDIEDLPQPAYMKDTDGKSVPVATRWWASNVVSWLSAKEPDTDRKTELQKLAGSILSD